MSESENSNDMITICTECYETFLADKKIIRKQILLIRKQQKQIDKLIIEHNELKINFTRVCDENDEVLKENFDLKYKD